MSNRMTQPVILTLLISGDPKSGGQRILKTESLQLLPPARSFFLLPCLDETPLSDARLVGDPQGLAGLLRDHTYCHLPLLPRRTVNIEVNCCSVCIVLHCGIRIHIAAPAVGLPALVDVLLSSFFNLTCISHAFSIHVQAAIIHQLHEAKCQQQLQQIDTVRAFKSRWAP